MKQVVLFLGVLVFFVACETGTKYKKNPVSESIDNFTENSSIVELINDNEPIESSYYDANAHLAVDEVAVPSVSQQFVGGIISDGLNVKRIRKGRHRNYERLVFDIQGWSAYGSMEEKKINNVGDYRATYNASRKLITVMLNGYKGFTAPLPSFSRESVIEKIYFDTYKDDSGYKFHIKLKESTEVKVFDLKSPARMVFDIKSI